MKQKLNKENSKRIGDNFKNFSQSQLTTSYTSIDTGINFTIQKKETRNYNPYQKIKSNNFSTQPKSYPAPNTNINFTIQKKENNTGLPNNLKSGIENLSGIDMSDVKVHYNSSQPTQLNAYAFAQGNQIHIAPGQEKHLPHEAWHVVQQKQGRVKPTKQLKSNVNINDDPGLEKEADEMGLKASLSNVNQDKKSKSYNSLKTKRMIQLLTKDSNSTQGIIQLHGERTAMYAVRIATGVTDHQPRRGNRRGSIMNTGGLSRARLWFFRNKMGLFNNSQNNFLYNEAVKFASNANFPNPDNFVRNNWQAIQGWAALQCEVGNCGEFARILLEQLVRTTSHQWIHKCCMYPTNQYDHTFIITYPNGIPSGQIIPNSVDLNLAVLADAWYGYKIMTVQQFLNGDNLYNANNLTRDNIFVENSKEATGEDVIAPIKNSITELCRNFNTEFNAELNKGQNGLLSNRINTNDIDLRDGVFDTHGSNINSIQDSRTFAQKILNSTNAENLEIITEAGINEIITFYRGANNNQRQIILDYINRDRNLHFQ